MRTHKSDLAHLFRLTDDTGIMEHAIGSIPRRKEGYSTDDQARALWVCLEWMDLADPCERGELSRLIDTYLSFLLWAQDEESGWFHNNFAYDRSRESETPSDDCLARSIWALALAVVRLPERERRLAAEHMLEKAWSAAEQIQSPRAWAFGLAAIRLLKQHEYPVPDHLGHQLASRLIGFYRKQVSHDWRWFEPIVAYSNGVMPWGLLCWYEECMERQVLDTALESLDFLIRLMTSIQGHIRPVGNRGWCTREKRALWDQQPIDVMKLALAAAKAFEITGQFRYAEVAARCREWFLGANDAGVPMIDPASGGCYDGITEHGVNLNQGAEAIISYLITEALYRVHIQPLSQVNV